LRLGATGTGLDIEKSIAGIQLAGKHPLEFQIGHHASIAFQIPHDLGHRRLVAFLAGQRQQFGDFVQTPVKALVQTPVKAFQSLNHYFQLGTFLAERLRSFGIVPDIRLLQLPVDFDQSLALGFEVKDTPSETRSAPASRRSG